MEFLILIVLLLFPVCGILAVRFGRVSLEQIRNSDGRQKGSRIAIWGIVLGYMGLGTILLALLGFWAISSLGPWGPK